LKPLGNSRITSTVNFTYLFFRVYGLLTTLSLAVTVFQLECVKRRALDRRDAPTPPASSGPKALAHFSDTTAAEPDLVSMFERAHFYTGLSDDPPELIHRSDLLTRPFDIPSDRYSVIPEKTAHGVFDKVLNPIWRDTVCPEIVSLLKDQKRGIRVSSISTVRFSTPGNDGEPVFGPIIIWISVHPNSTAATACRDANSDILAILESHGVMGAAVHWIEGAVVRL
jgi:hypothetical protein